jgi:plasmid stability protein
MSQITLRQIPKDLETRLRAMAQESHTSLNKTIIAILLKALGLSSGGRKKRNLDDLSGSWDSSEAEEFEKNTAVFERIDPEIWQS